MADVEAAQEEPMKQEGDIDVPWSWICPITNEVRTKPLNPQHSYYQTQTQNPKPKTQNPKPKTPNTASISLLQD